MAQSKRPTVQFSWVDLSTSFDPLSDLWKEVGIKSDVKVSMPNQTGDDFQVLANKINESQTRFPNAHAYGGKYIAGGKVQSSHVRITTKEVAGDKGIKT